MTDTLAIELSKDTLQLVVDFTVKAIPQSQDETISKEWITVIGMTLVAILTIVSQYFLTRKTTKSDFDKIKDSDRIRFFSKESF